MLADSRAVLETKSLKLKTVLQINEILMAVLRNDIKDNWRITGQVA